MDSVKLGDGLDDIVAKLRALPAELASKNGGPIRQALAKAARMVRDDARRRVAVSDGDGPHLREQIITYRDRDPRKIGAAEHYEVVVRFKARKYKNNKSNRRRGRVGEKYRTNGDFFYWRFLEFGTSAMAAKPFLRPAFENNKAAMLEIFQTELAKAVNRALVKSLK